MSCHSYTSSRRRAKSRKYNEALCVLRHRRPTIATTVSIPPSAPRAPTTAQCVYGSNGRLISVPVLTVAPRKEYSVMPVMKAAIAHARKTRGKEKMILRR